MSFRAQSVDIDISEHIQSRIGTCTISHATEEGNVARYTFIYGMDPHLQMNASIQKLNPETTDRWRGAVVVLKHTFMGPCFEDMDDNDALIVAEYMVILSSN